MSKARYHDMRLRDQLKLAGMLLSAQIAHAWPKAHGKGVYKALTRAKAEIHAAINELDERLAK